MTNRELKREAVRIMKEEYDMVVKQKEIHLLEACKDGSMIKFGYGEKVIEDGQTYFKFEITHTADNTHAEVHYWN